MNTKEREVSKFDPTTPAKALIALRREQETIATNQELAALRARVAELEGDLSVARLQLGARVCSECPAKARVAELEALVSDMREAREERAPASSGAAT